VGHASTVTGTATGVGAANPFGAGGADGGGGADAPSRFKILTFPGICVMPGGGAASFFFGSLVLTVFFSCVGVLLLGVGDLELRGALVFLAGNL